MPTCSTASGCSSASAVAVRIPDSAGPIPQQNPFGAPAAAAPSRSPQRRGSRADASPAKRRRRETAPSAHRRPKNQRSAGRAPRCGGGLPRLVAVALRDADVVLERLVRGVERVLQLVALEDVVVAGAARRSAGAAG